MRVVAVFDPPMAWDHFKEWRAQREDIAAAVPQKAIRVDVGRTDDGDFVRVMVADEYADRFTDT
jgi:hypothetical protein